MKMNKVNSLDKARELGHAISQSDEYLALKKAEADFYDDKCAKELLDKFNSDNTSLPKHEFDILQDKIECNIVIQNLFNAQKNYNNLVKNVNNIIDYITGIEKKNCSSNKCDSCNCSKR